jgi:hypothetical protein
MPSITAVGMAYAPLVAPVIENDGNF